MAHGLALAGSLANRGAARRLPAFQRPVPQDAVGGIGPVAVEADRQRGLAQLHLRQALFVGGVSAALLRCDEAGPKHGRVRVQG